MRIQLIQGISGRRCPLCRNEKIPWRRRGLPSAADRFARTWRIGSCPAVARLSLTGHVGATSRPEQVGLTAPHQAEAVRPPEPQKVPAPPPGRRAPRTWPGLGPAGPMTRTACCRVGAAGA